MFLWKFVAISFEIWYETSNSKKSRSLDTYSCRMDSFFGTPLLIHLTHLYDTNYPCLVSHGTLKFRHMYRSINNKAGNQTKHPPREIFLRLQWILLATMLWLWLRPSDTRLLKMQLSMIWLSRGLHWMVLQETVNLSRPTPHLLTLILRLMLLNLWKP